MAKNDRIRRLIPMFEQRRIMLPEQFFRSNYEGKSEDLMDIFLNEEYLSFPVAPHDDMLDALARMEDEAITVTFPLDWGDDIEDHDEQGRSEIGGY